MKRGTLGVTLLGVWLILHGLAMVIGLHFVGFSMLLGILALVSGILIILGR